MKDGTAPIVVALGGNAISPAGEEANIARQFHQTRQTVAGLRRLLVSGAPMIVTHGNGPQVGDAIRRVELAAHEVYPLDLGICVADVQGGMGYMIAQCMMNDLRRQGRARIVTTIVTTVEVDRNDPAFSSPSKPIGSIFPREEAGQYMQDYGWEMVEIPDRGFRRVVPSPRPIAIVEIDLIRKLVEGGELLVAVGGGGIPVYREADGTLEGCEAVIDKDLASGLLAGGIDAATLFIVTAVDKVCLDYGKPSQRKLDRLAVAEAREHLKAGQFPPGSMGPKIQAAVDFLDSSQRDDARVIICDIEHISQAMDGKAGTVITRS
jgi:carbamate kinase